MTDPPFTALLLDASVILAALDSDDRNHTACQVLLRSPDLRLATLDLALYETTNVVTVAWRVPDLLTVVLSVIEEIGSDGGLVRSDRLLLESAAEISTDHGISVYDAAYAAGAALSSRQLVSCDQRDLVARGLAVLPGQIGGA